MLSGSSYCRCSSSKLLGTAVDLLSLHWSFAGFGKDLISSVTSLYFIATDYAFEYIHRTAVFLKKRFF